jgi:hypothetical protein
MRRLAFTSTSLLCCLAFATAVFAQTSKATSGSAPKTAPKKDVAAAAAPAPPSPEVMKARMRPPLKGTASVDYIISKPKVVKDEIVMPMQVKNTSNSPIAGFRVDLYFYKGKDEISAGTGRVRNPIAPGEVVDLSITAPNKPGITGNTMRFSHANGAVQPTAVKKFGEKDDAKKAAPAPAKKK